jgi:[ribosomal protein S18]-alanine N-acetyltransferase
MNVVFRRMQNKDVGEICKIENDLFEDAWSKSSFLYEIKNISFSFPFVLILDNIIVGYCVCWFYEKELHIGNFAIKNDFQNKGIGKILMQKIFALFPDYQQAYLEVNVSNKAAISLYLKFGFTVLSTRKSYYANGEDALVMVKYN